MTCTIEFRAVEYGGEPGHWGAFTRIVSTDPRCQAGVEATLSYDDFHGNDQSATASGQQDAGLDVTNVAGDVRASYAAYFTQCQTSSSNVCWTGEYYLQPK